jgi:uncharacterized protein YdcH (DUF465 family)
MERSLAGNPSVSGEVARLQERHHELERRLAALDRHLSLTPDEQVECARLKKEKLRIKDRMQSLMAEPPRRPGNV